MNIRRTFAVFLLLVMPALALGGCGAVKEAIDLVRWDNTHKGH